jgi:hypothetical protein
VPDLALGRRFTASGVLQAPRWFAGFRWARVARQVDPDLLAAPGSGYRGGDFTGRAPHDPMGTSTRPRLGTQTWPPVGTFFMATGTGLALSALARLLHWVRRWKGHWSQPEKAFRPWNE